MRDKLKFFKAWRKWAECLQPGRRSSQMDQRQDGNQPDGKTKPYQTGFPFTHPLILWDMVV